jgi:hypothetical protein
MKKISSEFSNLISALKSNEGQVPSPIDISIESVIDMSDSVLDNEAFAFYGTGEIQRQMNKSFVKFHPMDSWRYKMESHDNERKRISYEDSEDFSSPFTFNESNFYRKALEWGK